jgi:hypothetical protein
MGEMAGAFGPKSLKGSPVTINPQVEDVDAVVKQAVAAGARITLPLADPVWGDRYARLEDRFGHHGSVATHIRDRSRRGRSRRSRSRPTVGSSNTQWDSNTLFAWLHEVAALRRAA